MNLLGWSVHQVADKRSVDEHQVAQHSEHLEMGWRVDEARTLYMAESVAVAAPVSYPKASGIQIVAQLFANFALR